MLSHCLKTTAALLLCTSFAAGAGTITTDSLLTMRYEKASTLMSEGRLDEAQAQFDSAFATAGVERHEIYPLIVNEQATLNLWFGKRAEAISGKRAVIPMLHDFGDTELDVSVYSDLGLLYHRCNRTDSAIYFHEKADSAARVLGDPGWLASVTQNIGVMYYNLKRFDDARRYLQRAAEYGRQTDDAYTQVCSRQLLSSAQLELGETAEGGRNAKAAWAIAVASGDKMLQLRCIPALYRFFEATNSPDSVDKYMHEGERLLKDMPQNSVVSLGYVLSRARMHFKRGEFAEALQWFEKQQQSPMESERAALMEQMAQCHHALGHTEEAYRYMDSARMWTDTLAQRDVAARLDEFNVKYNTLEHRLENAELRERVLRRDRMLLAVILAVAIPAGAVVYFRHRARNTRRDMEEMMRRRELESAQQYIEGLEDERKHFAKELHDGVANDLLGLRMKIEAGRDDTETIAAMVDNTRNTVRRISHHLMPPEFNRMTLPEVLQAYAASLNRDQDTEIRFTDNTGSTDIPARISREIYRIAQEYLMNILQHGNASRIDISLTTGDNGNLTMSITDNSTSIADPDAPRTGIGLRTMADRTKAINATANLAREENRNIFTLDIPETEQ